MAFERFWYLLTSSSPVVAATAEGMPTKQSARTENSAATRKGKESDRRVCITGSSFGGWAVSLRPLALRPRLTAGVPFFRACVDMAPRTSPEGDDRCPSCRRWPGAPLTNSQGVAGADAGLLSGERER